MLKSTCCMLRNKPDEELFAHDECPYDQGGYFIINGSEKVLISQERSAGNIVQVFQKKGGPIPFVAEVRSSLEKGSRLLSSSQVKLYSKGEVGKFYHENAVIHFPVYLDPEVLKFFGRRADEQHLSIEALLNQILKREMVQIRTGA